MLSPRSTGLAACRVPRTALATPEGFTKPTIRRPGPGTSARSRLGDATASAIRFISTDRVVEGRQLDPEDRVLHILAQSPTLTRTKRPPVLPSSPESTSMIVIDTLSVILITLTLARPKYEQHGDPHDVYRGQDTDQEEDGHAWRSVPEVDTTDEDCTI